MSKSESLEAKPSEAEPLEVEPSKAEPSEAKLSEVELSVAELPEVKLSETKSSEPKPSGIRPPSKIERLCSSRPRRPDIPPPSPVKSVTTKITCTHENATHAHGSLVNERERALYLRSSSHKLLVRGASRSSTVRDNTSLAKEKLSRWSLYGNRAAVK